MKGDRWVCGVCGDTFTTAHNAALCCAEPCQLCGRAVSIKTRETYGIDGGGTVLFAHAQCKLKALRHREQS
jgi:hypothetical protein